MNFKRMATLVVAFSITGALHAMLPAKKAVNNATLAPTWCAPLAKLVPGFPATGCVVFPVTTITAENPLIITPGLDKTFNKTANTAKLKEVYGYYFVQDGKTNNHRLLGFDATSPQDIVVCLMTSTNNGVQVDALKKLATEKGLTLTAGYEGKEGASNTKNCFVLTNAGSKIAEGLGGSISPLQKKFTSTKIVTPAQPAVPARPARLTSAPTATPCTCANPTPAQPAKPAVLLSAETPYIYPTQ